MQDDARWYKMIENISNDGEWWKLMKTCERSRQMMNDLRDVFGSHMPSLSEVGEQGNPPNNDPYSGIWRWVKQPWMKMNHEKMTHTHTLMNDSDDERTRHSDNKVAEDVNGCQIIVEWHIATHEILSKGNTRFIHGTEKVKDHNTF